MTNGWTISYDPYCTRTWTFIRRIIDIITLCLITLVNCDKSIVILTHGLKMIREDSNWRVRIFHDVVKRVHSKIICPIICDATSFSIYSDKHYFGLCRRGNSDGTTSHIVKVMKNQYVAFMEDLHDSLLKIRSDSLERYRISSRRL